MRYVLISMLCFCSFSVAVAGDDKMSGEDLKNILMKSESEHARHQNDLNADEMHLLLKKKKGGDGQPDDGKKKKHDNGGSSLSVPGIFSSGADVVEVRPDADKDAQWPGAEAPDSQAPTKNSTSPQRPASMSPGSGRPDTSNGAKAIRPRGRIPPGWNLSGAAGGTAQKIKVLSSEENEKTVPLFGIRRGSVIRAKLLRATTNVEPGKAEFETTTDCFGDFSDLPARTKIFLDKRVANGSNRLYFFSSGSVNVIAPDGKEFSVNCSVTDTTVNRQLGLVGAITTDQKLIRRSLASGAFAAGKGVVGSLGAGGDLAAGVVGAAADKALEEKEAESSASLGEPSFVILVSPQEVYIRVDKSF